MSSDRIQAVRKVHSSAQPETLNPNFSFLYAKAGSQKFKRNFTIQKTMVNRK